MGRKKKSLRHKRPQLTPEEREWLRSGKKVGGGSKGHRKNVAKGSDRDTRVTSVISGGLPTLGKRG